MATFKKLTNANESDNKLWKELLIDTFVKTCAILDKHNVNWFLYWGTLLGFYREGDFLEFDGDIDVAIDPATVTIEFLEDAKHLFRHVKNSCFAFSYDELYDAVKNRKTTDLLNFQFASNDIIKLNEENYSIRKRVVVDCVLLYPLTDKHTYSSYSERLYSTCNPIHLHQPKRRFTTKYCDVNIPANPEKYLTEVYGKTWHIKDPNYNGIQDTNRYEYGVVKKSVMGELVWDWKTMKMYNLATNLKAKLKLAMTGHIHTDRLSQNRVFET